MKNVKIHFHVANLCYSIITTLVFMSNLCICKLKNKFVLAGMSPSQNGLHQNSMQIGMAPQHHGGRCSVTGSAQQQTQSQQLGLGEPQR